MELNLELANAILQEVISTKNVLNEKALLDRLKTLRNDCAKDKLIQLLLASNREFQEYLKYYLYSNTSTEDNLMSSLQNMAWQLLANTIVNNSNTQHIIWEIHGALILENCCKEPLTRQTDIKLMIVYNTFKGNTYLLTSQTVLKLIIEIMGKMKAESYNDTLEYLHFLYEHFVVIDGHETVINLMKLTSEERIIFLGYVSVYIFYNSPNGLVHPFLLQHISKEFKMKSDCVLRQLTQEIDKSHPREVHALLRVIANATGNEDYEETIQQDHALFLNISSLLRCIVAAGKKSSNMFTPMNKLEEVAPASTQVSRDFEKEVSFEMKSLLVRCITNLLHNNPTNQGYCLDIQLMPILLECTNVDARNPLIKEWSILAIRNACINCPEIQEIVANLTNQGLAKNDILDELNLQMGSLRIKPSQD